MLKEYKNVKVNYEADAIIEINTMEYRIHDCIDGEDILVETEGEYPYLAKVLKPSPHRITNGLNKTPAINICIHVTAQIKNVALKWF